MKTFEIRGSVRTELGKKESKKIRKQLAVPCVLYGGEENVHFLVEELRFKNIVYTPAIYLIKIKLEDKTYDAVIKDIQFHPVSDRILHIDFVEVFSDKAFTVTLPVTLTGNSIGILEGGKLRQRRRTLKVRGLLENMPESLEIDMTEMRIGDSVKVGDLKYDKLEILDPPRAMIAGVVSSRLIAKGLREEVPEKGKEVEVAAEADVAGGIDHAGEGETSE